MKIVLTFTPVEIIELLKEPLADRGYQAEAIEIRCPAGVKFEDDAGTPVHPGTVSQLHTIEVHCQSTDLPARKKRRRGGPESTA
jgi:hypothetical protein